MICEIQPLVELVTSYFCSADCCNEIQRLTAYSKKKRTQTNPLRLTSIDSEGYVILDENEPIELNRLNSNGLHRKNARFLKKMDGLSCGTILDSQELRNAASSKWHEKQRSLLANEAAMSLKINEMAGRVTCSIPDSRRDTKIESRYLRNETGMSFNLSEMVPADTFTIPDLHRRGGLALPFSFGGKVGGTLALPSLLRAGGQMGLWQALPLQFRETNSRTVTQRTANIPPAKPQFPHWLATKIWQRDRIATIAICRNVRLGGHREIN